MRHPRRVRGALSAMLGTVALAAGVLPVLQASPAAAATGVTLRVENSANATAIGTYKWLINADNVGDPAMSADAVKNCLPTRAQPAPAAPVGTPNAIFNGAGTGDWRNCSWPSLHAVVGTSPVVATGDQTELNGSNGSKVEQSLADGKYLISVTAGGKPVSGMKFNFQPTESGLPAVAEITDGKCQTKVTPGKYTWYVSAGKDEALLSTVPEEYLEGAMERQIEVKGGDAIEVSLD